MYYPESRQIYSPEKLKLQYEDVYFENAHNQKLHGWWFPARTQKAKGSFVFFHGNAENMTSHFLSMSWLPEAGYNYFIFDYPGYFDSQGKPNPQSNVISGIAALEWVYKKTQKPLLVYGQSMGGIVAMRSVIETKSRIPIETLIVDGSFASFKGVAKEVMSNFWLTWPFQWIPGLSMSDEWAPDVKQISPVPLLLLHGVRDPVVSVAQSEKIFAEALEPKKLILVPEGSHGDLFWVEGMKYREILFQNIHTLKKSKKL